MLATILSIASSGLQIVLKAMGWVHDTQEQEIGVQTQKAADLEASNQEGVSAQKDIAAVDQLSRDRLINELKGPIQK